VILRREDPRRALGVYVAEEERGGLPYAFRLDGGSIATAREVGSGAGTPLTRWQVHHFTRT